jgi:hypothetical protein
MEITLASKASWDKTDKMPAANERFGATAAGSADLKGSA